MASGIAGRVLDLKKDVIRESLTDFKNVEHRLEEVGKVHGIYFHVNDSKATNVNCYLVRLRKLSEIQSFG